VVGRIAGGQHGVVGRWQLLEMGLTRDAIDGRVKSGRLHPFHHGVYAVGHTSLTTESRWMAAVLAHGSDAVLSHRSAGQLWRIVPRGGKAPEVTRPGFSRQRPGIVCHRASITGDERGIVDGIPVTSVFRTIFDLAGVLTRRELERAFHEAEVRELRDRLSLWGLLERHPGRRGAAALRAVLEARAPVGITRNDLEERFVVLLDAYGLPRPRLNATLPLRG
jgi:hypothetical protein